MILKLITTPDDAPLGSMASLTQAIQHFCGLDASCEHTLMNKRPPHPRPEHEVLQGQCSDFSAPLVRSGLADEKIRNSDSNCPAEVRPPPIRTR